MNTVFTSQDYFGSENAKENLAFDMEIKFVAWANCSFDLLLLIKVN